MSLTSSSKLEKGYKLFVENYVFNYEVSEIVGGEVAVRAHCHKSMRKREPPHCLQITLQSGIVPAVVMSTSCSCAAGKILCNHLVALLYQSAHFSTLKLPVVPADLSCTEELQTWHRPRTQGIKPEAVSEMIVSKPRLKKATKAVVKSTLYPAHSGPLPDQHLMTIGEKLKHIQPQLGICKILSGLEEMTMVDSKFGLVPHGSVLSYQYPAKDTGGYVKDLGAPDFPSLPVEGYSFKSDHVFVPTYAQSVHMESLQVTAALSTAIEAQTRGQSNSPVWFEARRPRLTASRFREACHVRGESTARSLACRILRGNIQTAAMKRGLKLEEGILKIYAENGNLSVYPCGFIVHPDAPHLGASPDGRVYDPSENPQFGLVEVKCCDTNTISEVKHLTKDLCVKKSHKYYWQVQGQLAVSGLEWCDFVTDTDTQLTVQRIWKDNDTIM
ncbi:unnamed protein product [Knipowitschia caucasica]